MRGLQITLFILGLMLLGTQTFRHIYVKWIQPTGSVLDAYRTETEDEIVASKDLDDLVAVYDEAHKKVEAHEKTNDTSELPPWQRWEEEPYKSKHEAEQAIEQWEAQSRSIFELRFYWLVGLASIMLGIIAYKRVNRWLGMVGIITGFVEMIVWTSPLWRAWGPQGAFDRLLNEKLILSLLAVALLITLWLVHVRRGGLARDPTPE